VHVLNGDMLIYELKLPLHNSDSKFAPINAGPGESIGIEVKIDAGEISAKDDYARKNREANRQMSRRRSRRPPAMMTPGKSIDFWLRIDLAKNQS